MIEPEAAPPAPQTRRHRRIVVAGVTLLAVVAGGFAVATGGDRPEGKPLALMATNGNGAPGRRRWRPGRRPTAAPGLGPRPTAGRPCPTPTWGWGLTFKVDGDLPELPDHAAAWKVDRPRPRPGRHDPHRRRPRRVRLSGAAGRRLVGRRRRLDAQRLSRR